MSHIETILRLPNVFCWPYLSSATACSTRTIDQSASNSSATIMGNEVRTPWPISERETVIVTMLLFSMRRKTPGVNEAVAEAGVGSTASAAADGAGVGSAASAVAADVGLTASTVADAAGV